MDEGNAINRVNYAVNRRNRARITKPIFGVLGNNPRVPVVAPLLIQVKSHGTSKIDRN